MKKFDQNNENLVSFAERALRARIAFGEGRLRIIGNMILKQEELKVKGVSPDKAEESRKQFNKGREEATQLLSRYVEKHSKGKNTKKTLIPAALHNMQTVRSKQHEGPMVMY